MLNPQKTLLRSFNSKDPRVGTNQICRGLRRWAETNLATCARIRNPKEGEIISSVNLLPKSFRRPESCYPIYKVESEVIVQVVRYEQQDARH